MHGEFARIADELGLGSTLSQMLRTGANGYGTPSLCEADASTDIAKALQKAEREEFDIRLREEEEPYDFDPYEYNHFCWLIRKRAIRILRHKKKAAKLKLKH